MKHVDFHWADVLANVNKRRADLAAMIEWLSSTILIESRCGT